MASISSPGLGSGLDVNSIVSQLVALERRPIDMLTKQQDSLKAKLSSFGLLQSYTVNVRDAVARLAKPGLWETVKATSSDSTSLGVSATASAATGTYNVKVNKLAEAHAIASGSYASSSAEVGTGQITISIGTYSSAIPPVFTATKNTSITVQADASGNPTLADLRDSINAAGAGVVASIVNTGTSSSKLVIRSIETGTSNSIRLTATPDAGAPSLSSLVYNPTTSTTNSTETNPAVDAEMVIDGLTVTSPSNTAKNVLDGVTLSLTKVTTSALKVSVGPDTAAMRSAVDDFVKAYNDINKYIATETKYDPESKTAGALQGDAATRSLLNQLRGMIGLTSTASATFKRLSDVGLELQKDGSLQVDGSKFADATANTAAVKAAFSADGATDDSDGFAVRFKDLTTDLTSTDGLVTSRSEGLRSRINRVEKDIERYTARIAATEARLLRQYSALDGSLSEINRLGTMVSQQITSWNNSKN